MSTLDDYDWVSCTKFASVGASLSRHLILKTTRKKAHWQTTVCGSTASTKGVWRKNRTKPECTSCVRIAKERGVMK